MHKLIDDRSQSGGTQDSVSCTRSVVMVAPNPVILRHLCQVDVLSVIFAFLHYDTDISIAASILDISIPRLKLTP